MSDIATPALMHHQEEGIAFLLQRRSGLLAFEQGLGKTRVAIEAFRRLRAGRRDLRLVVIGPNSLKRNWAIEVERFGPELTVEIVQGGPAERRQTLAETRADVIVMNYELARAEVIAVRAAMQVRPAVLVLDESHFVKTYRSLTSTATRHLAPLTEYRWLLTGTPVTNRPVDLYSQINVVADNHPLGSFESFNAIYGTSETTVVDRGTLAQMIEPYILRRTKEECLDLPAKSFVDIAVELPAWQRRLYDQMRDKLMCEVEAMTPEQFSCYAPSALTQVLRLSQLASNPRLIFPTEVRDSGKALELDRLLHEIVVEGGRKVILWSYYVGTIEALTQRYAALGAVALYGGVAPADRQGIAGAFQEDPAVRLLVANPAAAGTGFTLTASSFTVYETLSWRYDQYAQSQDRNHRIGQGLPVTYIRLIAADTIEQAIAEALERKARQAAEVLGDEDPIAEIAELTREGFCELLRTGSWPARA